MKRIIISLLLSFSIAQVYGAQDGSDRQFARETEQKLARAAARETQESVEYMAPDFDVQNSTSSSSQNPIAMDSSQDLKRAREHQEISSKDLMYIDADTCPDLKAMVKHYIESGVHPDHIKIRIKIRTEIPLLEFFSKIACQPDDYFLFYLLKKGATLGEQDNGDEISNRFNGRYISRIIDQVSPLATYILMKFGAQLKAPNRDVDAYDRTCFTQIFGDRLIDRPLSSALFYYPKWIVCSYLYGEDVRDINVRNETILQDMYHYLTENFTSLCNKKYEGEEGIAHDDDIHAIYNCVIPLLIRLGTQVDNYKEQFREYLRQKGENCNKFEQLFALVDQALEERVQSKKDIASFVATLIHKDPASLVAAYTGDHFVCSSAAQEVEALRKELEQGFAQCQQRYQQEEAARMYAQSEQGELEYTGSFLTDDNYFNASISSSSSASLHQQSEAALQSQSHQLQGASSSSSSSSGQKGTKRKFDDAEDGRDDNKRIKRDEPGNGNGSSSSNMNV